MRHLSPEEMLDIVEGAQPETGAPHLAVCDICRRELSELRSVMGEAGRVEVPEPSPLFWDYLSARVREAVAAEKASRPAAWMLGSWTWRLAAAGGVLVVALAVGLTVKSEREPEEQVAAVEASVPLGQETSPGGDDPSLALLADLAGDLDWDRVAEAGIVMRMGDADRAIGDMSREERTELQRLLTVELRGGGA